MNNNNTLNSAQSNASETFSSSTVRANGDGKVEISFTRKRQTAANAIGRRHRERMERQDRF
mgnify:FL=1